MVERWGLVGQGGECVELRGFEFDVGGGGIGAEFVDGFGADDALNRRETLELVRAYYRITDAAVRKRVFELIKSMGPA